MPEEIATMSSATISVLDNPSDADRRAILTPLDAFNTARAGNENYEPIAVVLRDETGDIVGGLWAQLYFDWAFIELLFVPESLRGAEFGSVKRRRSSRQKAPSAYGSTRSVFKRPASMSVRAMSASARSRIIREA